MARVNKFSLTNILKKAQLNFKSSNQGLLVINIYFISFYLSLFLIYSFLLLLVRFYTLLFSLLSHL